MKRVLLDTNIYGRLVLDNTRSKIKERLENPKHFVVYGTHIIRKELRNTPKKIRIGNVGLRNDLLQVYDEITKGRMLPITPFEHEIADHYFKLYKELKGKCSKEELFHDFLLVACAAHHRLDIVVSDDARTLLSGSALKAYTLVHAIKNLPTPRFLLYEEFKKQLM